MHTTQRVVFQAKSSPTPALANNRRAVKKNALHFLGSSKERLVRLIARVAGYPF